MNFVIIFGLFFFVVGVALFVAAVVQGNKAKAAQEWPTTPGRILYVGLQENTSSDSDNGTSYTYEPKVTYEYTLMGQRYTADRIAFGTMSYDYRTASKKIAPYQQDATVTVHYDPSDPSKAVLEPKSAGAVVLYLLGSLFTVIGLVVTIADLFVK